MLGILPGTIGLIQATETVKLILGIGEPLVGRLLLYDALGMRFRELKLRKNPECPVCGEHRTITRLIDYHQFCGVRSAKACGILRQAGFQHVRNMKGGILAWADKVDASVPKY